MSAPLLFRALLCYCACSLPLQAGETDFSLQVLPDKVRVRWPLLPGGPAHSLTTRRWQLERSANLNTWLPEGAPVVAPPGGGAGMGIVEAAAQGMRGFFRLQVTDDPAFLAAADGEAMGYVTAMDGHLAANGGITPQNFPALFPGTAGLPAVSFDATAAEYWTQWNTDPAAWNAALPTNSPNRRDTDFRLTADENELLRRNGFVVSEARGTHSFVDLYYRIWSDDLPVYLSSDSILHAWHRTWITILEELEEFTLRSRMGTILSGLNQKLHLREDPETFELVMDLPPALDRPGRDALEWLGMAAGLMGYTGWTPDPNTRFGRAIAATGLSEESIFGSPRLIDWTQFEPRAHYTNSDTLKNYFRSMMWLGLVDMRMDVRAEDNTLRQLGAAVVVTLALDEMGLIDDWLEMDRVVTAFSGQADALTPPQLLEILQAEGLGSFAAFTGPEKLEQLLTRILAGQAGVQQITAHPIPAPLGERALVLPRSFCFFPQRFTPESWAFTRTVFDKIWRENPDPAGPPMVRVRRRLPTALDINFAVMGNDTPAAHLSQRMTMTGGVPFRDGYDYSRELVSVRQVMDSMPSTAWGDSLYLRCLDAIRTLSAPLPATVPEAMRTEAWQWKTVHTQLAAWTELRHDNLLYAKQSYTPPGTCFYPAGYVEPRPEFYAAMKRMVDFAHGTLTALPVSGVFPGRPVPPNSPYPLKPVNLASRKTEWLNHFAGMSATLQSLTELAAAEVNRQPFSAAQTDFIRGLVSNPSMGYSTTRAYTGWYPRLYLVSVFWNVTDPHPAERWDPLVADIHTDGPDLIENDPGAVLYNSTGNVAFMLVAIDVNGQRCLHGGPVFTYYEFTRPLGEPRLTDQVWKTQVRNKQQPAHPGWTNSFLVPGPITIPLGVQ